MDYLDVREGSAATRSGWEVGIEVDVGRVRWKREQHVRLETEIADGW